MLKAEYAQLPSSEFLYYMALGLNLTLLSAAMFFSTSLPISYLLFAFIAGLLVFISKQSACFIFDILYVWVCFSCYVIIAYTYSTLSNSLEAQAILQIWSSKHYLFISLFYFCTAVLITLAAPHLTSNQKAPIKNKPLFKILMLVNVCLLLLAHSVAYIIIYVGPYALGASGILFPLAFANSDTITEYYGNDHNNIIVWAMVFTQCSFIAIVYTLSFFHSVTSLQTITNHLPFQLFAATPSILVAFVLGGSIIAYLRLYKLRLFWRVVVSTILAKASLSLINYCILFIGVFGVDKTLDIMLHMWILKTILGLTLLPYVIFLTKAARILSSSVYHRVDCYNPLKMRIYSHAD